MAAGCNPFAELYITDGTTTVDLLRRKNGVCLLDWLPSVRQVKGGGQWRGSSQSDGRDLVAWVWDNQIDVFTLGISKRSSDNSLDQLDDLHLLLIKAHEYGTASNQRTPVYLVARFPHESGIHYSLIKAWQVPSINNPYQNPFFGFGTRGRVLLNEVQLTIEHESWTGVPPGFPCPTPRTETQTECFPSNLEFDGDTSIVNCGSDASTDDLPDFAVAGKGQITVEIWVRTDGYGEGNLGQVANKSAALGARGWFLRVDSTSGLVARVDCAAQSAISSSGLDEFTADGLDHYVLMTYDETGGGTPAARTIYFNVDGTWIASYLTQQASIGNYLSDAADSLIIGNVAAGTAGFDGGIGWIRISDSIRYDPAGGNFTPEPRCELPDIDGNVVLQEIYEGAGTTTYDRSGNDNNGAISNATWACTCTSTTTTSIGCNCAQASGQQDWDHLGWPINTALPVHDVNDIIELPSGRLLACDATNEVWRTDDGGATPWVASTTPPNPLNCNAMTRDIVTGDIFVAGRDNIGANNEVWRTQDDGINWVQRTGVNGANTINSIEHWHRDGYLYLADFSGTGVYRSNDGGATWALVFRASIYFRPHCIGVTDDAVFVGGSQPHTAEIYRSSDGLTWNLVFSKFDIGIAVIMVKQVGQYLYASLQSNELLESRDGGLTWGEVSVFPADLNDMILCDDGLFYAVVVNSGIYRARDPSSWQLVDTSPAAPGPFSMLPWSGSPGSVYVGSRGEIRSKSPDLALGRSATCLDEVFIGNETNIAQLTQVLIYDAAPVTWVSQFPAAAFPYNLFPAVPAVGDIFYAGIETAIFDSGPFSSLVFDIRDILTATSWTIVWEYWNGAAWAALNVYDETQQFSQTGVRSVHWVPPSDWAANAVNAITAYWMRARITAIVGAISAPTQQNRDVYTINRPCVDVDDAQVPGTIAALARIQARNRSDEDGYDTKDELTLLDNFLFIGTRKTDLGPTFVPAINCADEQNPIGITVTVGTGTAFANNTRAPSGRSAIHTTTGNGLTVWDDALVITFGPSIAADFFGGFHFYARMHLYEPAAAPVGTWEDVRVRLKLQTGSGGIFEATKFAQFVGHDDNGDTYRDFVLLDFGASELPVSGDPATGDLPDQFTITVQIASDTSTNLLVEMYDVWLMPVDEWSCAYVDTALEDDSGVINGDYLDADALGNPGDRRRSFVRLVGSDYFKARYSARSPGPPLLQSRSDQRVCFLSAKALYRGKCTNGAPSATVLQETRADFVRAGVRVGDTVYNITTANSATVEIVAATQLTTSTIAANWTANDVYWIICEHWVSEPEVAHSIRLEVLPRYLVARGSR